MGLACVCLRNLVVGLTDLKIPLFFPFVLSFEICVRIVDVQVLVEEKNLSQTTKKPSNFYRYDNDINLFILEQKLHCLMFFREMLARL